MRMRDADRLEAAEPFDQGDGGGIEHGDAVPQHVAVRCAHQQRALTDGETGLRPDADDAGLVLAPGVEAGGGERLQRGPALSGGWDVLALLFADRALPGCCVLRRILHAAGGANECRHDHFLRACMASDIRARCVMISASAGFIRVSSCASAKSCIARVRRAEVQVLSAASVAALRLKCTCIASTCRETPVPDSMFSRALCRFAICRCAAKMIVPGAVPAAKALLKCTSRSFGRPAKVASISASTASADASATTAITSSSVTVPRPCA